MHVNDNQITIFTCSKCAAFLTVTEHAHGNECNKCIIFEKTKIDIAKREIISDAIYNKIVNDNSDCFVLEKMPFEYIGGNYVMEVINVFGITKTVIKISDTDGKCFFYSRKLETKEGRDIYYYLFGKNLIPKNSIDY